MGAGLFTAYNLMLGNFGGVDYADKSATVLVLIVFFTISVNIILLNTLIAIISDTYEKELDKSRQASLLERATLLCEIEDVDLSEAELLRLDYFPDWLHVLKRKNDAGKEEQSTAMTLPSLGRNATPSPRIRAPITSRRSSSGVRPSAATPDTTIVAGILARP